MRNKLKVKDIRRLTGLTGAEIAWFHHQKVVQASGYSNYSVEGHDGYKEFDRRDLPKFQQIAMYYDLGLRRNEIRDIMKAKDYDCGRALDDLYVQLKEKRDRLERHMIAIEHLRMIGTKGNVLDYLRGSSMESLGANYQLLQNSGTWAEMQTQFLQMPTESFEQQIITCAQNLAALSDEALQGEAGASAISALVETMTGNLGLMGYILMLAIPAGVLGEGTMADDVPAMLGAELSEAQARAIMEYLEADLDRAYSEIIDIIVQYHSFFGGEYDSEEIRAMADAAKVVAKTYFGISQEIEYRLLFELMPPKPVKHEKDYLNYLYNALYHYHQKETQK